jgi:NAD(P)-dependent dehydrogenase (short-subunit alcohol dehydrogenase family)
MSTKQSPVAVFTGATAGLGEAILKAYANTHPNGRIYFVGRNAAAAEKITSEIQQFWKDNPKVSERSGSITFLKCDLSLLCNVRNLAGDIIQKEGGPENAYFDLICMSQGILSMRGRTPTTENHDMPFVLQLYSRIYLVYLLLPYLRKSRLPHGARVVSVHAPGHEGHLWLDDLELMQRHASWLDWLFPSWFRHLTNTDPGYTINGRVTHSSVMTTLFFEGLAEREREEESRGDDGEDRGVAFLHVFPGLVKTQEMEKGDFPAWLTFLLTKVLLPVITPLTDRVEDVGMGITGLAEDERFCGARTGLDERGEVCAVGSNGDVGSGAYCVNWRGKRQIKDGTMRKLREKGASEAVWQHCVDMFEGVHSGAG